MKKLNYSIIEKYKMKIPVIGITLDSENDNCYSKFPWYAIRKNYLHSIEEFGGIPFPLYHSMKNLDYILSLIDGVIITGGNFDINPLFYLKNNTNSRKEKKLRTAFEMKLCEKSLTKDIPVLGICGGEQLINVCLGGTLIQDIKSLKYETLEHEQINPRDQTSHKVFIEPKTIIHQIIGQDEINVNSAHHQAVDKLGKDLQIGSKSIDGIIESIESLNHKWCIGIQWHPEFLITKADKQIISNFIQSSK